MRRRARGSLSARLPSRLFWRSSWRPSLESASGPSGVTGGQRAGTATGALPSILHPMRSHCPIAGRSLHQPLQPGKRIVPLRGDLVQTLAGSEQRPRFELPDALAADLGAVSETGLSKNVQVLGDSLACDT